MRRFVVTTEGRDQLGLRQVCEAFANDLWIPDHLTGKQAVAFVLECFKRTVARVERRVPRERIGQ